MKLVNQCIYNKYFTKCYIFKNNYYLDYYHSPLKLYITSVNMFVYNIVLKHKSMK